MHREAKTPLIAAAAPLNPRAGESPMDSKAIARWLAKAHRDPRIAAAEWRDQGLAMLPLGVRYSAVRIPDDAVATVSGYRERAQWDAYLCDAIGGPLFCDPRGHRYYALVSCRTAGAWQHLSERWRTIGVELLGEGWTVGVPSPFGTPDPEGRRSYWAAPAPSAGLFCPPLAVLQLIDAALTAQSVESCTDWGGEP